MIRLKQTWRAYHRIIVLSLLLALLLIPSIAGANGTGVYWSVIASGGGTVQNGGASISFTIGQPSVGVYANPPGQVQAGFWNTLLGGWVSYLPFIGKNAP